MSKQGAVLATKKSARRVLVGATTVGVDLGDQWSHYCILDEDGEITEECRFRTSERGVAKRFEEMDHARVAMEAGTPSIWISEQLKEYQLRGPWPWKQPCLPDGSMTIFCLMLQP